MNKERSPNSFKARKLREVFDSGTPKPSKIGWPTLVGRYVEKGGRQKPKQQMEVFIKVLYTFENQWFYSRQQQNACSVVYFENEFHLLLYNFATEELLLLIF